MSVVGRAASSIGISIARLMLTALGAAAITWAVIVFPAFWSEKVIVDVAAAITRGEVFDPEVLAVVAARTEGRGSRLRSATLSKAAMINLRQAENAMHGSDSVLIQRRLESVTRSVRQALDNAPDDPFLWLVWFSLDTYRHGARADSMRFLRMSYRLGPYEGWIAVRRDRIALASFQALPPDLRQRAVSEFVRLVRWGFIIEAADIAAGPARPLRAMLFPELKRLTYEQRHAFADAIYGRGLDDVPVPGIQPPPPPVSMPVMPPDL
jgi:hypothetical protein